MRVCKRCGGSIEAKRPGSKYCVACANEIRLERQRGYAEEARQYLAEKKAKKEYTRIETVENGIKRIRWVQI